MGARFYSPGTGRFISQDPIGYVSGLNLYTYCNSNPINYIDPLGLDDDKTDHGTNSAINEGMKQAISNASDVLGIISLYGIYTGGTLTLSIAGAEIGIPITAISGAGLTLSALGKIISTAEFRGGKQNIKPGDLSSEEVKKLLNMDKKQLQEAFKKAKKDPKLRDIIKKLQKSKTYRRCGQD